MAGKTGLAPTIEDAIRPKVMPWPRKGLGRREILEMCGEGVSVIFISSELDEIIRCSNRIVVMRDRKQVGVVNGEGCTQQTLLNIIANGMQEGATA